MNCSLPGSSEHGILQTRILDWVAMPFSRGSSQPRDQTCISSIGRQILYRLSHQGSPEESRLTQWQMPVHEHLIIGKKTWVTRRAHRRGTHPSGTCSLDWPSPPTHDHQWGVKLGQDRSLGDPQLQHVDCTIREGRTVASLESPRHSGSKRISIFTEMRLEPPPSAHPISTQGNTLLSALRFRILNKIFFFFNHCSHF